LEFLFVSIEFLKNRSIGAEKITHVYMKVMHVFV